MVKPIYAIHTANPVININELGSVAPDYLQLNTTNIDSELGSYTGSGVDVSDFSRKSVFIELSALGSANYWVEASPDNSVWYIVGSSASELVADVNIIRTFTNHYPYLRVRLEMETGSCNATITGRGN